MSAPVAWRALDLLRALARRLPRPLRRLLRPLAGPLLGWVARRRARHSSVEERSATEVAIFAGQEEVHELPPIFHYWSEKWLRPELEAFGFSNPEEFFAYYIERSAQELKRPLRIVSLGSGNCDAEVRVAELLRRRGLEEFRIECIDINEAMLARGRALVAARGLSSHIQPLAGNFNDWRPQARYELVLANQSLHHVLNLEGLFTAIESALAPDGRFVTSDMIGRNGHQRWPEALQIVQEYWCELPKPYRFNLQLRRRERSFKDWDCSWESFEGIRAQDILPLLLERFDFEFFFAFGNLIDPFIDRGFGPHFDPAREWDRDFIDRVQRRDETELRAGTITPTHMLGVLRRRPYDGGLRCREGLDPARCVRRAVA